ncbi:MAG: hypothetical protein AAB214_17570, partial [Fibrobacterota bacterium]
CKSDLPKGWSLDELNQALQLDHEIPDDSICIDPAGRSQHWSELEDWVLDLAAPDRSISADNFRRIREALKHMVGASTIKEWTSMLGELSRLNIPSYEMAILIEALHALLETESIGGAL